MSEGGEKGVQRVETRDPGEWKRRQGGGFSFKASDVPSALLAKPGNSFFGCDERKGRDGETVERGSVWGGNFAG